MLPALGKYLLLAVACILGAGIFYSLFAHAFIPVPADIDIGLLAGACCVLPAAKFALQRPVPARVAGFNLRNNKLLRVVGIGLLAFWGGFSLFAMTLPSLYTMALGAPAVRQTMVSGWHARSRRSCAGPDIPDASTITTRLCLSAKLPVGTALTLHGEQSALGFEVESFAPTP